MLRRWAPQSNSGFERLEPAIEQFEDWVPPGIARQQRLWGRLFWQTLGRDLARFGSEACGIREDLPTINGNGEGGSSAGIGSSPSAPLLYSRIAAVAVARQKVFLRIGSALVDYRSLANGKPINRTTSKPSGRAEVRVRVGSPLGEPRDRRCGSTIVVEACS